MWFLADGDYLNQNHIVRLEESADGGSIIHLVGGKTITSHHTIDDITNDTGTLIQAHPGFELLSLSKDLSTVSREPVIAWRLNFIEGDTPSAITPSGSSFERAARTAISYPNGSVFDRTSERWHQDVDSWSAAVCEQKRVEQRKLKVGGER